MSYELSLDTRAWVKDMQEDRYIYTWQNADHKSDNNGQKADNKSNKHHARN